MKNKKIVVKNVEDYNKFIKILFLYKTLFYRNVFFSCKVNPLFKDVKSIIEALNIKNRKKGIEYIYDYSCSYIDNYCEKKDFCKFKSNKCLNQYKTEYENGCCRGCRYQSKKGCVTSNLTCKLFYCSSVKEHNIIITLKDLKILKLFSLRQKTIVKHDFFVSRETMLKDLYLGGIIIFTFKTIFRLRYIRKQTKKTN